MEIWKNVEGFEELCEVSNLGRIRNKRGKIFIPHIKPNGYVYTGFYKDGKQSMHYVHRLVAKAFIDNPDNLDEVNHKDGNKRNNEHTNLEWIDRSGNLRHAFDEGLKGSLNKSQKEYIRNNFKSRDNEYGATPLAKKFGVSCDVIWRLTGGASVEEIDIEGSDRKGLKLNKDEVDFIIANCRKYGGEYTQSELAEKFNVSRQTVNYIVNGKARTTKISL